MRKLALDAWLASTIGFLKSTFQAPIWPYAFVIASALSEALADISASEAAQKKEFRFVFYTWVLYNLSFVLYQSSLLIGIGLVRGNAVFTVATYILPLLWGLFVNHESLGIWGTLGLVFGSLAFVCFVIGGYD